MNIKTPDIMWKPADQVKSWAELYEAVAGILGEGDEIQPETIGKNKRDFCYEQIMFIVLRNTEIVYSYQPDSGEFTPEFVGTYLEK